MGSGLEIPLFQLVFVVIESDLLTGLFVQDDFERTPPLQTRCSHPMLSQRKNNSCLLKNFTHEFITGFEYVFILFCASTMKQTLLEVVREAPVSKQT